MNSAALRWFRCTRALALTWLVLLCQESLFSALEFSVASYNVENYLDAPSGTRPVKSSESRSKIRESIRALNPDLIGLQEVGGAGALDELRKSLKMEGFDYPHWELVPGSDTNIEVAVLSKFPLVARHPHTNDGFLLNGRRFRMTRGIVEVDVQVTTNYSFTLFVAHLKSKRPVADADEADLREQEGLLLREKIDARLRGHPELDLIVVGDLNDGKDSKSTRAVIGKGRAALIDARPAEKNGDSPPPSERAVAARNITWTHFYAKEDNYSRLDYILVTRGMARSLDQSGTYVLALPHWGDASDHRPIVASFKLKPEKSN